MSHNSLLIHHNRKNLILHRFISRSRVWKYFQSCLLLIPILKKLSFYLQKQKNFYSNPNCGFGDSRVCQNYNLVYYKNFFAIEDRMIISSELDSETSFYITKNSFQPILRSKNLWPLYCKCLWRLQLCEACNEFLWHLQMIQKYFWNPQTIYFHW